MSTLFIDCTQLVHWPGRLTGIPRVMNELTLRYAKQDNCAFVIWSPEQACYYLIDVEATLAQRGQGIVYVSPQQTKTAATKAAHATKTFSRRALGRLKRYGAPVPGRVIAKLQPVGPDAERASMQKGDTLFVLWGEQASESFIAALKTLHADGIALIQASYDLLPLVTPQYSGHSTQAMETYNREIFPICKMVLAISESTKRDIISWLTERNLAVPAIEVFRLGDDFKLSKPSKPTNAAFKASRLKGNDFILCVGTIEARKNHTLLYYAYKLAAERGLSMPRLVIVGRRGWMTENLYELLTLDPVTKDTFVLLTDLSDEELSWLYANCKFSIYPSFYEGWGLPVAESIAHGVPCLASWTSSIPEIAGDLIDYFSPVSSDECLAAIQNLLQPKELEKAKKRVAKYRPHTWDETFEQVDKSIKENTNV
jgi:glycosyltransferase involved in cell wall biosynthesis